MATAVGSVPVRMPLIFDTGSAGVTLYAPSIFPASMVSGTGFVFPSGQSSITYNGITVTNQQGTRSYGTTDIRMQNGNLGYAQLTFGDAQGRLTTTVMPIFLYFSITDAATGEEIEVPSFQQGIFGVASTNGTITVAGSAEPAGGYLGCAAGSEGTCFVVSALKYLQYGTSVSAGFMLSPAAIQSCAITTPGSCTPTPMLTVGLTTALEEGFSTVSLPCPPERLCRTSGDCWIPGVPENRRGYDRHDIGGRCGIDRQWRRFRYRYGQHADCDTCGQLISIQRARWLISANRDLLRAHIQLRQYQRRPARNNCQRGLLWRDDYWDWLFHRELFFHRLELRHRRVEMNEEFSQRKSTSSKVSQPAAARDVDRFALNIAIKGRSGNMNCATMDSRSRLSWPTTVASPSRNVPNARSIRISELA
jgi:hypothetical protein